MNTYIKHAIFTITVSIALLGISSQSFAGGYIKKVNYSDLDLDQPGDVAVLYKRIKIAARMVCKDGLGPKDFVIWMSIYNDCFHTTMDKAVQDVNNRNLSALHQGPLKNLSIVSK